MGYGVWRGIYGWGVWEDYSWKIAGFNEERNVLGCHSVPGQGFGVLAISMLSNIPDEGINAENN
jgi:hypothetical protein